eukprot:CAMPEP_0197656502 /NCGR_PEP_ID=MMETSP1338-20131121/42125_1 /TAXON_ID=43686 ORGANISM="Pelagodinium beii, Strain RCC1491" /NCGR_SAMPLE_ID=MMETSP1338 /ASSEMBLY_ACC=CAM_ASM_000754 /LENGTH=76 /DNA_ID=CAMNT_0043232521 /DNA_START=15 /DNA_END=245 /DNA_ORIENTATION=-
MRAKCESQAHCKGSQFSTSPPCAFLRRAMVERTVAAGPVVKVQQPPACVLPQDLDWHFQMPAATRFTFSLPQKLQK